MRLLGIALLSAWLLAWWASPHGEPAPQTSIVGGVAIAGGDRAAVAWLELPRARGGAGRLNVALVDEQNRVTRLFREGASASTTSYRLADAGDGSFVLASEYRSETDEEGQGMVQPPDPGPTARTLLFSRFDAHGLLRGPLLLEGRGGDWQFAAAGDQLAVAEEVADHVEARVLSTEGAWLPPVRGARILVGAADGRLIRYEVGAHRDHLAIDPGRADEWGLDVAHVAVKDCGLPRAATPGSPSPAPPEASPGAGDAEVVSVIPLRGGYARLARKNNVGCVDGMRDGLPFFHKDIDLRLFAAARLSLERIGDETRLAIYDVREGQTRSYRIVLDEKPGGGPALERLAGRDLAGDAAVRYRLFGRGGSLGVPTLGTRMTPDETLVVFERFQPAPPVDVPDSMGVHDVPFGARHLGFEPRAARVTQSLAPQRAYLPDHRPMLRRLALVPLGAFLLAALGALRLLRRLRRLAPAGPGTPLAQGQVAVEGTLVRDAEAPEGGLRLRRGSMPLRLFLEGAEVLRASEVRPRDQPRGDAVDVASGAPVVATGVAEPGAAFRGEDTLRAGPGDLVIVGCSLAEARARVNGRLLGSVAVLGAAASLIGYLALGR